MFSTWLILLLIAGLIYIFHYYIQFYCKWKNGPPGPIPIPILGNLLEIMRLQFLNKPSPSGPQIIAMMSKKYGDIWRLRIGSKDFVVCSSVPAVNQIMARDETLGKDIENLFYDRINGQNSGMLSSEGPIWERHRKWTFKNLNMLGMRKRGGGIQFKIYDQLSPVLDKFEKCLNSSAEIEVGPLFLLPITKVVFGFIIGNRINEAEIEHQLEKCIEGSEEMAKSAAVTGGIDIAFPILRILFPGLMGRNQVKSCTKIVRKFAQDILMESREGKDEETLATLFVKEMEEHPKDMSISDFHFGTIFFDLLQASSDTTNSHLQFLIFHSVLYPECQEKIYNELVSAVGPDEQIELEHRNKMPYTDAFMLESHRCGKLVPNFNPHKVTVDFKCDKSGYTIPKGAIIMADMFTANDDTQIWTNPEKFYPDRFMDNENLKKLLLPFGAGKRICPGESIAEGIAFLFFTNILRSFKISQVPGSKLTKADVAIGFSSTPKPFSVLLSRR